MFERVLFFQPQLCQSYGDGPMLGFFQIYFYGLESLGCFRSVEVQEQTDELVASEANYQIVGADLGAYSIDRPAKELIAGGMA
jgi:hypothetical protein